MKSNEQKAREYADKQVPEANNQKTINNAPFNTNGDLWQLTYDYYLAGLTAASQMISVKDKKPEQGKRVLVYKFAAVLMCYGVAYWNGKKFLFDATLIHDSVFFSQVSDRVVFGITHWQPLPDKPKEV